MEVTVWKKYSQDAHPMNNGNLNVQSGIFRGFIGNGTLLPVFFLLIN